MKSRSDQVFRSDRWRDPRAVLPAPSFPHVLFRPEDTRARHGVEALGCQVEEGRKRHYQRCLDCDEEFPAECSDAGYRHVLSTGHRLAEFHIMEVIRTARPAAREQYLKLVEDDK